MSNINDKITQAKERVKQLEHQKRAQEAREKKKQAGIDKERQKIIGMLVSEIFPEVSRFQPSRSNTDNQIEFTPLRNFLTLLASEKEFVSKLKAKAYHMTNYKNQQLSDGELPPNV